MTSTDGAHCIHGWNIYHPQQCPQCYKEEIEMAQYNEKWDFTKWFLLITVLFAIAGGLFAFTGAGGKLFGTFVERKVFEQSYQRSEALKAKIATFEAQLAEINTQLSQTQDTFRRNELVRQRSAIQVQLNAARAQQ